MSKPCILCVAITGSVPTKADNPAVPTTVTEQIESTHEAFEAGASIAHCHVRNDDQTPTSDPDRFAALMEGLILRGADHAQDTLDFEYEQKAADLDLEWRSAAERE